MPPLNVVRLNASEHSIKKVTVYPDRAAVQRILPIDVKSGQNEISITRLPNVLEPDSIRIESESTDASQSLTVLDVVYIEPRMERVELPLSDPLSELEDKRSILSNHRTALDEGVLTLREYARSVTAKDATSEQLEKFLELYVSQSKKLHASRMEVDKDIRTVDRQLAELRVKDNFESKTKKYSGVNVIAQARNDGSASLVLSYIVTYASWSPLYDIRAEIESQLASQKTNSAPTINIQYRASISQATGEDWNDVLLTLSTTSPLIGSDIPTLRPWNIGTIRRQVVPVTISSQIVPATISYDGNSDRLERGRRSNPRTQYSRTKSRSPSYGPPSPEDGVHRRGDTGGDSYKVNAPFSGSLPPRALVNEGAIGSTFEVDGLSTIPSGGSSHKVSITVLDLPSELTWVTVPRTTPSAFLQCHIKNTSSYIILAGTGNVFMDGNFVCKSKVPDVSPQEYFSCSLGVDPSVRITYHPQKRNMRTQGSTILSKASKRQITTVNQRIRIKNTRSSTIYRLIVRDQVPNSEDSRVKVTVIKPDEKFIGAPSQSYSISGSGASSGNERLHYVVQKGVVAQWAQKNEDESGGSGGARGDGVIEWICSELEAVLDLELEYEVSVPPGLSWS